MRVDWVRLREERGITMKYRVIQWATGNVGKHAVRGLVEHPETELVGAYVYSAEKAGRDVGDI